MTTNSLNNECLNDFTIGNGVSGATRQLRVENTNDTASSDAAIETYVEGTSADDTYSRYVISTTNSYAHGIDNTDSQSFNLAYAASAAATPSSTKAIKATTGGELLYPSQPLFKAYSTVAQTNVTGDSTGVQIQFTNEEIDQNSNYDTGTGRFTAPVAGRYFFASSVQLENIGAGHTTGAGFSIYLNGTSIAIASNFYNPAAKRSTTTSTITVHFSSIIELAASDTIRVFGSIGGGAKVVDTPDFTGTPAIHRVFFAGTLLG